MSELEQDRKAEQLVKLVESFYRARGYVVQTTITKKDAEPTKASILSRESIYTTYCSPNITPKEKEIND